MDICTIVAKNYIAHARVLARSFAEFHPTGRCSVLIIDELDGHIDPEAEPFTVITPAEIGCEEFEEMALRYTVLELSTAVKPWLLAHLLREGAPAITYLDPDIRVFSSLEALDRLAVSHGVVLTPHNTVPLPDDGERPNQIDILLAGVYNLGYVSLGASDETHELLGWWRKRLLTDCLVDPHRGYFVDQRWFDLAPGLVSDHAIVRDPQYNLAYWNLHSRRLDDGDGSYTVDGVPLAFFHFSGFDPDKPGQLSRHQSRISLADHPPLAKICAQYSEELLAAGYREASVWPYTYDTLPSGVSFSGTLRGLYEVAVERGEVSGSPFTADGCDSFMAWLGAPAPAAPPGVNQLLAHLYGTREDLQQAFPDVAGGDHQGLLGWAREDGVREEPALGALPPLEPPADGSPTSGQAPPTGADARASEVVDGPPTPPDAPVPAAELQPAAVPWGVNVVGYFRSELGVGEAARQIVSALDAHNVPLLPVHGRRIPPNRQGHVYTHLDHSDARYPVNLICMNADALGEFAQQAGPSFFENRYSIGVWFWEVEKFPRRWHSAFEHIDELWIATDHVIRAVSPFSSVPVTKVTLPVELPPLPPATRSELQLPEGFMFHFSFDHHSVFERKNPLAVVDAYLKAFGPDEGAVLVIRSINGDSARADHDRLLTAASGRPDIHIIDEYVSAERKDLTLASCDCYVSLHRAEGFGLTMAEAMYLGKPVIATGYSGNLDFMNSENSLLVDHELVAIGENAPPYPADGRWAEPDVEQASSLMREVFDRPQEAGERGRRAAGDIRRTHSAVAAGRVMAQRLEVLRERDGSRLSGGGEVLSGQTRVGELVRAGPPAHASSRLGPPGKLARRLLLRLMRPFTAYQHGLDVEMGRAVSSLATHVHNLEVQSTERDAMVLLELRRQRESRALWERIAALTRSVVELESVAGGLQRELGPEAGRRLEELTAAVGRLRAESDAIPYMAGTPFSEVELPRLGRVEGYSAGAGETADGYRSFEDTFRGGEDFIRDRQRVYLPIIGTRAPVLDLGCGRGEFLDLLAEAGIPYFGVDLDAGMVRRCQEKGHHDVVQGDGLEYLAGLPDGSLGAVFCAQVIEHLPYESLVRLLELARKKLLADGILIAETVNPHCPPALKTFWVDPTHQHPIFPEVALALCRSAGFGAGFVFHPNGSGDVERDRSVQGEYAVVAGPEVALADLAPTPEIVVAHRGG